MSIVDDDQHVDDSGLMIDPEQQTVDLKIPRTNLVTVKTIDLFRRMSLSRLKRDE